MRQPLSKAYPWIIWGLASSFLFYKYLLQVSPTIMVPELMREFSLTGEALGNLAACYFYAYLAMQLPVGLLLDRSSPRQLVALAITICATGGLLFGYAPNFFIACIGRVLIGLGGAFSAVGCMKLITVWFEPKRFALVSGMMMTVGMLGAVGGQAPLAFAVEQLGWRSALVHGGFIGLALAVLFWLIVRDHPLTKTTVQSTDEREPFFYGLVQIMKKPQSWLLSIYSGLAFAPISAFAGLWGVPFLMQDYHLSRPFTASITSLVFIGFAVGSPLSGWFSDRIQRRKPIMMIGTAFSLICLSAVIYVPHLSIASLVVLLFFFGFFTSLFFVSFAHMREINRKQSAGTAIGFINMFNAICGAFTEPLIGRLLDLGWGGKMNHGVRIFSLHNYQVSLLSLIILLGVALCLQFFIKETYCQQ